jgi:hypothetical protein
LDSRSGEHVRWSAPAIGIGDEITVKIIEAEQVTPEDSRFRRDELANPVVSEGEPEGLKQGRPRNDV